MPRGTLWWRSKPHARSSVSAVSAVSALSAIPAIPAVPAVSTRSAELRTAVCAALRAHSACGSSGWQQLFELLPQFEQPIHSAVEQLVVTAIEQLFTVVELEQRTIELEQRPIEFEQRAVEFEQRAIELKQQFAKFEQFLELEQFVEAARSSAGCHRRDQ